MQIFVEKLQKIKGNEEKTQNNKDVGCSLE